MMHKAWSSIEKVPYCFSRSSVKFQGHIALKISNLTQIGRFRTVTSVWIHRWLWNVAQSLKQQRRDALWFSKVIDQISRSHGTKHHRWAFPDYRPVAAFKSLRFALFVFIRGRRGYFYNQRPKNVTGCYLVYEKRISPDVATGPA